MSAFLSRLRIVIRRLATPPLAALAVVLMLLEEYLWKGLVRLGEQVGRLPAVRRLDARLASLPPAGAVTALLAPVCLAVPAKLVAVWIIASGHALLGVAVLLAVKVTGTALVARIYTLCETNLLRVAWFVRVRAAILAAKDWAHRRLEATAAWRMARQTLAGARRLLDSLLPSRQSPPPA